MHPGFREPAAKLHNLPWYTLHQTTLPSYRMKNDKEKIKLREYAEKHPLEVEPNSKEIDLLKTDLETLRFDAFKNKPSK
jgi:hypothetical protein